MFGKVHYVQHVVHLIARIRIKAIGIVLIMSGINMENGDIVT